MSPNVRLRMALLLSLAVGGACASRTASPAAGAGGRAVITRAELLENSDRNAFEAVRRLRPSWLRYRGQSVLTGPEREGLRIYLNGAYYGDAQALSNLQVIDVEEMRFLDAREATLRYGTGHTVGAIVVSTRVRASPVD
jgi:hypothetical protein